MLLPPLKYFYDLNFNLAKRFEKAEKQNAESSRKIENRYAESRKAVN